MLTILPTPAARGRDAAPGALVLLLLFGDSRPKNAPRSGSFFNTAAAPLSSDTEHGPIANKVDHYGVFSGVIESSRTCDLQRSEEGVDKRSELGF